MRAAKVDGIVKSMTNKTDRTRGWLVAGACLLAGLATGLWGIGVDLEEIAPHVFDDSVTGDVPFSAHENRYFVTVLFSFVAGLVAYALIPLAIKHVPAERDPDFPGTRGSLVAACVVAMLGFSYFAIPALMVALVSAYGRRSTMWSVAASVSLLLSFPIEWALTRFVGQEWDASWLLALPLVIVPTMLVGTARGRRRERQARLEAEAKLSQERLRSREEAARTAERERIARDMHDSLSHRLSLIALHSGALAYRSDMPQEKVAQVAGTIRDEAQAAVDDLRQVLSALRDTAPLPTVEQLLDEHRAAGGQVNVNGGTVQWPVPGLSTLASQTLVRAVQEGLTNARKHAPGQPVDVDFSVDGQQAVVRMSNPVVDGVQAAGSGLGLKGIEERARAAEGRFSLVSTEESFGWRLELPLRGKDQN